MSKPILTSSKTTFQWYLDNLERLAFYDITLEQHKKLSNSLAVIEDILNSLEEDLTEK